MATKYGTNATLLAANPPSKAGVGEQGGVVRMIYDKYVFAGDLATTDVILMGGKIPKGARILDVHVYFTDLDGSGGTIDVGYQASADAAMSANTDAFFDGIDVATAADMFKLSDQAAGVLASGVGLKFLGDCQPVIVTDGDTDATTGNIELFIYYILD